MEHAGKDLVASIDYNGKNNLEITNDRLEFLRCSDPEYHYINRIDKKYGE
jgi:hypothetical protein